MKKTTAKNSFVASVASSVDTTPATKKTAKKTATYDTSLTTTANGAVAYKSTLSTCLDLFGKIGSARGMNLNSTFENAYLEDPDMAVRILLWARDIRGGSGERKTFRDLIQYMETDSKYHDALEAVIRLIPVLGRWDDMFYFKTPKFRGLVFLMVAESICYLESFSDFIPELAALGKWLPREKTNRAEDRQFAKELAAFLQLTPKQYRKLVVSLTNVVETKMCDRKWSGIDFEKIPSVASRRYAKAFGRNAFADYSEYLGKVATGQAKMNAGAIFPHDITSVVYSNDIIQQAAAEAQWKSLPNYTNGVRILPMIDLSESMSSTVSGTKHSHRHIAISLGLYVSEKNTGAFKNVFLAFANSPKISKISGNTLSERYRSISNGQVGYDTNFQAAYEAILKHAVSNGVSDEEMPQVLLIPSDMQFNPTSWNAKPRAMDDMKSKFKKAGYTMPKIVFWNMNGTYDNVPVRANEHNVSLISGYSTAILKAVLGDADVEVPPVKTPYETMVDAVMVDRYNWKG